MPKRYHCDLETWSPVDLNKTAAYRYAEEAEILLSAVARESDTPVLWVNPRYRDVLASDPEADEILEEIQADKGSRVYAHNAMFEHALISTCGPWEIDVSQWRCTQRMAAFAGIQESLAKAGFDLLIDRPKDAGGKALIKKFCCPQADGSRIYPWQDPIAFAMFGAYCIRDVMAEQELHKYLKPFELDRYPHMVEAWTNTLKMNDRGFPVDTEFLAHGLGEYRQRCAEVADVFDEGTRISRKLGEKILGLEEEIGERKLLDHIIERCGTIDLVRDARAFLAEIKASEDPVGTFVAKTGLRPTQRDRFKEWVIARGYEGGNMQAETIAEHVGSVNEEARPILEAYATLSYAAPKKYVKMDMSKCRDNTIKGAFTFHGAKTGRWTSTGVQIQNVKKLTNPTEKERIFGLLDRREHMSVEDLASSVRFLVREPDGFLQADYTAIECVVANWISDQLDVLELFRTGEDVYKHNASKIFRKPVSEITDIERALGKVSELSCAYGTGVRGFLETCESWGVEGITDELAQACVDGYRLGHPKICGVMGEHKIPGMWQKCEKAFRAALLAPGERYDAGTKGIYYKASRLKIGHGHRMVVQAFLPSGRPINYYDARVSSTPDKWKKFPIEFWGCPPGTAIWCHIRTFSARLFENLCQAIAADLMMIGFNNCVRKDFIPRMLVHDEVLAAFDDRADDFSKALTTVPSWGEGLPLAADAEFRRSYGGL